MNEPNSTDHVLTLKDIEYERDVAMKASLTGSIEYVRMARQIESAVIDKLRRGECHTNLLVDLVRSRARDLSTAMGLLEEEGVAAREVAAFVACATWHNALQEQPPMSAVEAEAALRYRPKPAVPTVRIRRTDWRLNNGSWEGRAHDDGKWYQGAAPACISADDYTKVAEYMRSLPA